MHQPYELDHSCCWEPQAYGWNETAEYSSTFLHRNEQDSCKLQCILLHGGDVGRGTLKVKGIDGRVLKGGWRQEHGTGR
jgi:hypothetical protein